MELHLAAYDEVGVILYTLSEARKRPYSADFLDPLPQSPGSGFPWTSVSWYRADGMEVPELESLYLFWDGSVWGESPQEPPRALKRGIYDFRRIGYDITKPNYEHFVDILKHRGRYRVGAYRHAGCFLILVGEEVPGKPLLVLDGHHWAVAALWWKEKSGNQSQLPRTAWVGHSREMVKHWAYQRIPGSNQESR